MASLDSVRTFTLFYKKWSQIAILLKNVLRGGSRRASFPRNFLNRELKKLKKFGSVVVVAPAGLLSAVVCGIFILFRDIPQRRSCRGPVCVWWAWFRGGASGVWGGVRGGSCNVRFGGSLNCELAAVFRGCIRSKKSSPYQSRSIFDSFSKFGFELPLQNPALDLKIRSSGSFAEADSAKLPELRISKSRAGF